MDDTDASTAQEMLQNGVWQWWRRKSESLTATEKSRKIEGFLCVMGL